MTYFTQSQAVGIVRNNGVLEPTKRQTPDNLENKSLEGSRVDKRVLERSEIDCQKPYPMESPFLAYVLSITERQAVRTSSSPESSEDIGWQQHLLSVGCGSGLFASIRSKTSSAMYEQLYPSQTYKNASV